MYKNTFITLSIFLYFVASGSIYAGNTEDFEQGAIMYRKGGSVGANWHGHAGVFTYYSMSGTTGTIRYVHCNDTSPAIASKSKSRTISTNLNEIESLKNDLINHFRHNENYWGTFGKNISPSTLANIVSTALNMRNQGIVYVWVDMLHTGLYMSGGDFFHYPWYGNISDIGYCRCDGVPEYSYEKNGVMVAMSDNISYGGFSHLDAHNNLHEGGHSYVYNDELCPRIQSGISGIVSELQSLQVQDPTTNNFSYEQNGPLDPTTQLSFKISDNASKKTYVVVRVRKSGESNWNVLKDAYGTTWKFRELNLTNYSSGLQYDNFYVQWTGYYEGGRYDGNHNFETRISVIDQGANNSINDFSFSADLPETSIDISGPANLDWKEQGNWTANISYGYGTYNYEWRFRENGTGAWSSVVGSLQTFSRTMLDTDFELQLRVYGNGIDLYDTHYVYYGSFVPKQNLDTPADNVPENFSLTQNYPNPFNPETEIQFALPEPSHIQLTIINSTGVVVRTLAQGALSPGRHAIIWNGKNTEGQVVASGVYFYRLQATSASGKQFSKIMKMAFMK